MSAFDPKRTLIPCGLDALNDRKAAIDHQRGASDEGSLVAGEPDDWPGDLLGCRPARQKRRGLSLGLELFDAFAGSLCALGMEIGQRRARTDGVDRTPYTASSQASVRVTASMPALVAS